MTTEVADIFIEDGYVDEYYRARYYDAATGRFLSEIQSSSRAVLTSIGGWPTLQSRFHSNVGAPPFVVFEGWEHEKSDAPLRPILVTCTSRSLIPRHGMSAARLNCRVMPAGLHRYQQTGGGHFLTWSCYQRRQFLGKARHRDLFLQILEQVRHKFGFVILGYVVMP